MCALLNVFWGFFFLNTEGQRSTGMCVLFAIAQLRKILWQALVQFSFFKIHITAQRVVIGLAWKLLHGCLRLNLCVALYSEKLELRYLRVDNAGQTYK